MNPFDGLTKRQHELVYLALDSIRLFAWAGQNPPPKEKEEYDVLLEMLKRAKTKE
jgi:aryl carrier-like protein